MDEEKMRKKMMRKTKGELIDKIQFAFERIEWVDTFDDAQYLSVVDSLPKKDLVEIVLTLVEMSEE